MHKSAGFLRLCRLSRSWQPACLLLFALPAGCSDSAEERPEIPSAAAEPAHCTANGYLEVEVYGGLQTALDWRGPGLSCEGMPRPNGEGARLRFAGPLDENGHRLAFIIALPALQPGEPAAEIAATVTLMQEDTGQFYSNGDNETCWSDVNSQQPAGTANSYTIDGIVYCVAPLAELNGNGSVTLRDLRYSGRVSWQVAP